MTPFTHSLTPVINLICDYIEPSICCETVTPNPQEKVAETVHGVDFLLKKQWRTLWFNYGTWQLVKNTDIKDINILPFYTVLWASSKTVEAISSQTLNVASVPSDLHLVTEQSFLAFQSWQPMPEKKPSIFQWVLFNWFTIKILNRSTVLPCIVWIISHMKSSAQELSTHILFKIGKLNILSEPHGLTFFTSKAGRPYRKCAPITP